MTAFCPGSVILPLISGSVSSFIRVAPTFSCVLPLPTRRSAKSCSRYRRMPSSPSSYLSLASSFSFPSPFSSFFIFSAILAVSFADCAGEFQLASIPLPNLAGYPATFRSRVPLQLSSPPRALIEYDRPPRGPPLQLSALPRFSPFAAPSGWSSRLVSKSLRSSAEFSPAALYYCLTLLVEKFVAIRSFHSRNPLTTRTSTHSCSSYI